jgi:hypothetical protein
VDGDWVFVSGTMMSVGPADPRPRIEIEVTARRR